MQTTTTIKFNQNANDGDRIRLKLTYNGQPYTYPNGHDHIDKYFIKKQSVSKLRIAETNYNGDLTNAHNLGSIKGLNPVVNKIQVYEKYIIIGGHFNEYEHNGTTYPAKSILLIDKETGEPAKHNGVEIHSFFSINAGEVHDFVIRKNKGKTLLDVVGNFDDFSYVGLSGQQSTGTKDHFIEIDLSNFQCSVEWKQNWEGYTQVNNTILSCDVYGGDNQNLVLGGRFTQFQGSPMSKLVNLNPTLNPFLPFTGNHGSVLGGDIYKVYCHSQGDIFIGGEFNSVSGVTNAGICKLNYNGQVQYDPGTQFGFKIALGGNANVYDIIEEDYNVIFVGDFNSVNGNTAYNIAKVNMFGATYQSDLNSDVGALTVLKSISKIDLSGTSEKKQTDSLSDTNNVKKQPPAYVVGGDNTSALQDYNGHILDSNGKIIKNIFLNNEIKSTCTSGSTILYGGLFDLYDTDTSLTPEEIEIGTTLTDTRDNLLANLNQYNSIAGNYSMSAVDTDKIEIVIDKTDVYDIVVLGNKIESYPRIVITFEDEGLSFNDLLKPIMLRSDNILISKQGNKGTWNNVEFNIRGYLGDVGDFTNATEVTTVVKNRLTDNQLSQYLDVGQLLGQKDFKPDYYFNYVEDDFDRPNGVLSNRYRATDYLYFAAIQISNRLGTNNTLTDFSIGYVLDGYRKTREEITGNTYIMNNGSYREVRDYFNLTIYTADLTSLFITDLDTGITTNFPNAILPMDSNWLVSHFNLTPELGKNLKIEAVKVEGGRTDIMDTIYVHFRDKCKRYGTEPYELLFVNSFGVLENLPVYNLNSSFRHNTEDYRGFVRDINGSFNVDDHTDRINSKDAKKTITCNTGHIHEKMNSQIEDLFNSKQVWLVNRKKSLDFGDYDRPNRLIPVKLKGDLNIQTSYRDGNILYDFELEVDNYENKNIQ